MHPLQGFHCTQRAQPARRHREDPRRTVPDHLKTVISSQLCVEGRGCCAAAVPQATQNQLQEPRVDEFLAGEAGGHHGGAVIRILARNHLAALGLARRAFDEMIDHAARRKLFGAPLADLQLTQAALADSAVDIDAAALLVYRAAWEKDRGAARITREASMAKAFAPEMAQRVIDRAVQIFGGNGVRVGVKVEALYREIRALRIYEGATEVQKLIVARELLKARQSARRQAAE